MGAGRSALKTPCHAATGCGARQRSSRTGGAAKGIPSHAFTPEGRVIPSTWPDSTRTGAATDSVVIKLEVAIQQQAVNMLIRGLMT
jgi:hypothetical protein